MLPLSQRVLLPEQVRELDRIAIEGHGIAGYELMCRAGAAAVAAALEHFPAARRWRIFCGSGNNAGDGYVIGRLALNEGIAVELIAVAAPEALGGDAARAYADFVAADGAVKSWSDYPLTDSPAPDLIIDALLGTGLLRDLEGDYRAAVNAINAAAAPVLAVDTPTGLDAATGQVLGAAVCADLTVTFVGLKAGFYLGEGPRHVGCLQFAALDIPEQLATDLPVALNIFSATEAAGALPKRARDAHKVDHGHVLVIGGNQGMAGAARLAGEAALRSGAGLVSVATHPDNVNALVAGRPELMVHPVQHAVELDPLLKRAHVIALGPGLGRDSWARELWIRALEAGLPLVVDADALNWLAERPCRRDNWILTPHPGEAARLLDTTASQVQEDRVAALNELHTKYGGAVILKGAGTLVSGPEIPWLIAAGNPGMATAGMGDVLTGICAALLAQNRMCVDARQPALALSRLAATAAWVHASAADSVASARGERGMLASDIFPALRDFVNPCG
jgi:NAD(P)H-hydrate epimerase